MQHPWFGHGINTFKYLSGIEVWGVTLIMPHNIYAELLFSSGLIGSLLLCLGFILLYRKAVPVYEGFLGLTGQALLLYALLRGLLDMKLFSFEYLGLLFMGLGLLYARPQNR